MRSPQEYSNMISIRSVCGCTTKRIVISVGERVNRVKKCISGATPILFIGEVFQHIEVTFYSITEYMK